MKLKNMSEIVSDKNGIECPHCKHWNLHEECGTYEVWFPICIKCGECTEVPNE
jgi:DNA-directed RNA polymerase subunit RPC12/RpoP